MDEKRIEEIVQKVFDKAKTENASHSKHALSKHISLETDLSSKTLERTYDKYILGDIEEWSPSGHSIERLCKYLRYEGYSEYMSAKGGVEQETSKSTGEPKRKSGAKKKAKGNRSRNIIIGTGIALGALVSIVWFSKYNQDNDAVLNSVNSCMTWADSVYVKVPCITGPFSKFGTEVKPLNQMELKNMRKVKVTAAYPFFSEDGKPLIWYFKNEDNEHEFFTAPGLHPVAGETLRKITPYIIQTYIPMHQDKKESFVQ